MGSHTRPAHFPVLADEPVEIHRPRRTIRLIVAFFAAAILLTGGAAYLGTTYAVDRADSHLRHSRDQLATELAARRRQRDAEHAEVSRDLCTLVTRLPADPDTDALRRRYGCGPFTGTGAAPTVGPGADAGAEAVGEPDGKSPAARVRLAPPRAAPPAGSGHPGRPDTAAPPGRQLALPAPPRPGAGVSGPPGAPPPGAPGQLPPGAPAGHAAGEPDPPAGYPADQPGPAVGHAPGQVGTPAGHTAGQSGAPSGHGAGRPGHPPGAGTGGGAPTAGATSTGNPGPAGGRPKPGRPKPGKPGAAGKPGPAGKPGGRPAGPKGTPGGIRICLPLVGCVLGAG